MQGPTYLPLNGKVLQFYFDPNSILLRASVMMNGIINGVSYVNVDYFLEKDLNDWCM
jgi:hypothetical protein